MSRLIPPQIRQALRANFKASRSADRVGALYDPVPVVKLVLEAGAACWLASELYEDGETLFGLADLGLGFPELGTFSLPELEGLETHFGLRVVRDPAFATSLTLAQWADMARRHGSIRDAETHLAVSSSRSP